MWFLAKVSNFTLHCYIILIACRHRNVTNGSIVYFIIQRLFKLLLLPCVPWRLDKKQIPLSSIPYIFTFVLTLNCKSEENFSIIWIKKILFTYITVNNRSIWSIPIIWIYIEATGLHYWSSGQCLNTFGSALYRDPCIVILCIVTM